MVSTPRITIVLKQTIRGKGSTYPNNKTFTSVRHHELTTLCAGSFLLAFTLQKERKIAVDQTADVTVKKTNVKFCEPLRLLEKLC